MVLQFKLTNGNFNRNVSFNEDNTIGDIVDYLEGQYSKTTSNRLRLFRGKTFYNDEKKKLGNCGFKPNRIIKLTFTENYDGGEELD